MAVTNLCCISLFAFAIFFVIIYADHIGISLCLCSCVCIYVCTLYLFVGYAVLFGRIFFLFSVFTRATLC